MKQRIKEAQADQDVLRFSMDTKATVKVGPFARGGKSRVPTKAADHDFLYWLLGSSGRERGPWAFTARLFFVVR